MSVALPCSPYLLKSLLPMFDSHVKKPGRAERLRLRAASGRWHYLSITNSYLQNVATIVPVPAAAGICRCIGCR